MSFLSNLLGGGEANAANGSSLVSVAGQLIQQAGGVQGLSNLLQQHGLGDAVQSWIGHGANQPVGGGELGQALQNGGLGSVVANAASKMGVDQNQLLSQLSQVLPHAVDHLTPDGQVPASGSGFDMNALAGLAGKLFSGAKTA